MANSANTTIKPSNNSDVVRTYGRAAIMLRAWDAFRTMTGFSTFSKALSHAWASFRKELNRLGEHVAKTTKPTIAQLLAIIESNGAAIEKMEREECEKQDTIDRLRSYQRYPNWGVSGNAETFTTMAGR